MNNDRFDGCMIILFCSYQYNCSEALGNLDGVVEVSTIVPHAHDKFDSFEKKNIIHVTYMSLNPCGTLLFADHVS
jgi:hypothetical protein